MANNLLNPIWSAEAGRWDFEMAAHLLRRAGFGGAESEVQRLLDAGPQEAVESLMNFEGVKDDLKPMGFGEISGGPLGRGLGLAAPRGKQAPANLKNQQGKQPDKQGQMEALAALRSMTPQQRQALNQLDQGLQRAKLEELKLWWIDRMVRTPRPLEEKMTLFWHGLFVSSFITVRTTIYMYEQNELFRKFATGNYKDLAMAVSKNPAMLIYLNNNQNRKERPNENYARELMELFTLGIGNYTEKDVKESARAFTGWTNVGDRFVFNRREHDTGQKTFLGKTGNFTGADIIDIIFEQAACPRHIATRLLKFFAVDEPPEEIVTALAGVVSAHKFEMAPTLRTLFASQWFYSQDVMRRQIKSPVQLVVGSLRALGVGLAEPRQVDSALKLMGQDLFMAPTVKGWDGGRAWINTSTLFARYNLPAYLVTGKLPAGGHKPADPDLRDQYADFNSGWNPRVDLAQEDAATTDGAVDLYIKKLLGAPLDPKKREDLIEFVNASGDAKSHVLDPIAKETDHRVRSLVHLIMSMAEYQLA